MGRARTLYPALGVVIVLAIVLPVLVPSMATLVTLILAKSIVVLGIIILLHAGQVSFGHAMFIAKFSSAC
jgi:branched-chain amino acid transport system permease protein